MSLEHHRRNLYQYYAQPCRSHQDVENLEQVPSCDLLLDSALFALALAGSIYVIFHAFFAQNGYKKGSTCVSVCLSTGTPGRANLGLRVAWPEHWIDQTSVLLLSKNRSRTKVWKNAIYKTFIWWISSRKQFYTVNLMLKRYAYVFILPACYCYWW
jgi:hypothetical protein